jgi:hypothetical protein
MRKPNVVRPRSLATGTPTSAPKPLRRHFLRGAAGFALAIPFLPSIEPRSAKAGPPSSPKRFLAMATSHGAIWEGSMHPALGSLTQTQSYAGHTIRRGDLSLDVSRGTASLSPVLSASSSVFTSALASKMNVLRGLDVTWYIGHHTGGHLGNYARNDGNGDDGVQMQAFPRPTIDQVIAYHPGFYPATPLKRVMSCGESRLSYNYANPNDTSSEIVEQPTENSSISLFNQVYVPPEEPVEQRPPVVDRVLEDYNRLRNGNRRLSNQDRDRLDAHIQMLDELEQVLSFVPSCDEVTAPTMDSTDVWGGDYSRNPEKMGQYWQAFNRIIAIAFSCDTSRIATYHATDTFSDYLGADWHAEVAHRAHQPTALDPLPNVYAQPIIMQAHQQFFERVYLDLISLLDSIPDAGGGTLLDNSLVTWTQESGPYTHDSVDMPVIMAGGAAGEITTGSYIDYRNLNRDFNSGGYEGATEVTHPGLSWNQYLGTVLQTMGLAPDDYEETPQGGYGPTYVAQGSESWPTTVLNAQHDFLPFLKA